MARVFVLHTKGYQFKSGLLHNECIAQWQSNKLLIYWFWVQIPIHSILDLQFNRLKYIAHNNNDKGSSPFKSMEKQFNW